jgi:hypothetical protein
MQARRFFQRFFQRLLMVLEILALGTPVWDAHAWAGGWLEVSEAANRSSSEQANSVAKKYQKALQLFLSGNGVYPTELEKQLTQISASHTEALAEGARSLQPEAESAAPSTTSGGSGVADSTPGLSPQGPVTVTTVQERPAVWVFPGPRAGSPAQRQPATQRPGARR